MVFRRRDDFLQIDGDRFGWGESRLDLSSIGGVFSLFCSPG
jgi:hypothetical protein